MILHTQTSLFSQISPSNAHSICITITALHTNTILNWFHFIFIASLHLSFQLAASCKYSHWSQICFLWFLLIIYSKATLNKNEKWLFELTTNEPTKKEKKQQSSLPANTTTTTVLLLNPMPRGSK